MKRTARAHLGVAAAWAVALTLVPAGSAVTQPADPPGNNGTVKIDGVDFDSHPDNQPHVGCVFQVDFYGFDQGEDLSASVTFEAVPPTAGGVLLTDSVFIGGDAAGGGTDVDAQETYDLSGPLAGIEPHPVQGHHVRLTVNADGSQGDDTKHKVFWVEGCAPPTTTPTTPPPTTPPPTTGPPTTAPPTTQGPARGTTPSGGTTPTRGPSGRPGVPSQAAPAQAVPGQPDFTG